MKRYRKISGPLKTIMTQTRLPEIKPTASVAASYPQLNLTAWNSAYRPTSPNVLESISFNQLLALKVAKDTLVDAKMLGDSALHIDKSRTGVILGANLGGTAFPLRERITLPKRMQDVLRKHGVDESVISNVVGDIQEGYIDWNENSFPGFLTNIVSGRIVNRFDFGGPNFTVDAACASSICAIMQAIHELRSGQCDQILTGGVNVSNDPLSYLSFSKTPALSLKNEIRPYDKNADGMLVGDGIGMMMLMRLEDAVAQGRKIYSVIAGLGSSSDGKAKSIYAPRKEGQLLAIERAYKESNVRPEHIGLIEGHGTGTPVGDHCEVSALKEFFEAHELEQNSIPLGSIKSQIGHTTQAAGAASIIKVALALHHKVIPPTINVTEPNPDFGLENSPFYLSTKTVPWTPKGNHNRSAAISSFGFGGINYHLILEEPPAAECSQWRRTNQLPIQVILSADNPRALEQKISTLLDEVNKLGEFDPLGDVIKPYNGEELSPSHCRIGFVATTKQEAADKLTKAGAKLSSDSQQNWHLPNGIHYRTSALPKTAKVVAMFSGQGAQYSEMGKTLALNFPEAREAFTRVDQLLEKEHKLPLSSILFPTGTDHKLKSENALRLNRTEYVQPALAAFCVGSYQLLHKMGFTPDLALGHSFGELTALWAAGAITTDDLYRLSISRGHGMQNSRNEAGDPGAMLAVANPPGNLQDTLKSIGGIQVANCNSPEQKVVSGATESIAKLEAQLNSEGIKCVQLPVSGAFHSSHMNDAKAHFAKTVAKTDFSALQIPVYSNLTGSLYSPDNTNWTEALTQHLRGEVLFQQNIERAYDDGGRLFVEIGPKGILTNFAKATLKARDAEFITLNPSPGKDAVGQLLDAMVQLKLCGINLACDPYEAEPYTDASKGKSGVTARLHGRHYFTPGSLKRINRAGSAFGRPQQSEPASEPTKAPQEGSIEPQQIEPAKAMHISNKEMNVGHQATVKTTANAEQAVSSNQTASTPPQTTTAPTLALNDILQCQAANSQVQNSFYQTQSHQLSVLEKLLHHQQSVLEQVSNNGGASEQIGLQQAQAFESLCQHNQNLFASHEAFLNSQNAILSRLLGQQSTPLPLNTNQVSAVPMVQPPAIEIAPPASAAPVESVATPAPAVSPPQPQTASNVVSMAPETQAAQVFDEALFSGTLLGVVSEATGYPEDVIDQDMDLEADLGIDSIKRVEIFSSLNEKFPGYGDQIEVAELATLTTLKEITQYFSNIANSLSSTSATPASASVSEINAAQTQPQGTSSTPGDGITVEEFSKLLVETLVNATGYPADVIDFDMDLEADLGVDSIKRVEMFAALQDEYADSIKDVDPAELMELKTIQQIIDYFSSQHLNNAAPQGNHEATNLEPEEKKKSSPELKRNSTAIRYGIELSQCTVPEAKAPLNYEGHHILLTEDNWGTGDALYQWFKTTGAQVTLLRFSEFSTTSPRPTNADASDIVTFSLKELNDQSLGEWVRAITTARGKITGFIHNNPVIDGSEEAKDYLADDEFELVRVIYFLSKHLKLSLSESAPKSNEHFYLITTKMNGAIGLGHEHAHSTVQGGYCGLVKSLKMETPDLFCRCIDIAPGLNQSDCMDIIKQELGDKESSFLEVGRPSTNSRLIIQKHLMDTTTQSPQEAQPDQNSVFLVSGGGRGVTARCIERLASEYQCKFIILGRTPLGPPEPDWAVNHNDETGLRKALVQQAKSQGKKIVPVEIDKTVKQLLTQRELKQTLSDIEQLGGTAVYISEDITNTKAITKKVEEAVKTLGPINGLIHGAGNIADKLLEYKAEYDFELVFGTKVRSLRTLLACTQPEQLQHLILFSSISGFYGQFGQSDYSLSNEILNKFALQMGRSNNSCNVKSINWGPWDGGMVSPSLKNVYRKFNVQVMPIEEGVQFFMDEFTHQDADVKQMLVCPKNIDEVRQNLASQPVF